MHSQADCSTRLLLCLLLMILLLLQRVGLGLPLSAALSCSQPALPASCWRLACLPARVCTDISLSRMQGIFVFNLMLSMQALSISGQSTSWQDKCVEALCLPGAPDS